MSEKDLSADVMYKYIKSYSKLSREEIAGMYAIANKRNVELEEEIKLLKNEIRKKEERIADASNTIEELKYMVIAEREDNINLEIIDFDLTLEKAKEKANKYAKKGIFESIIIAGHDRFLREW